MNLCLNETYIIRAYFKINTLPIGTVEFELPDLEVIEYQGTRFEVPDFKILENCGD